MTRLGRWPCLWLLLAWLSVWGLGATAAVAGPVPILDLTAAERRFLADHPTLRVGVGGGQPPFQTIVRTPGEAPRYVGLAADILDAITPMLGVNLQLAFDVTFTRALELAQTGGIDMFACITDTPSRRAFLHMTRPYASHPYVMITRTDRDGVWNMADLRGKVIAVSPTFYAYERLQLEYPDLGARFDFQKNALTTMAAVADGQADACFLNLVAATAIIRDQGYDNLRVAAVMPWPNNDVCMASQHPLLASILQKALDAIPQDRKRAMAATWFAGTVPTAGAIGATPRWLAGAAAALAALAAAGWWWRRRLRTEVTRRKAMEIDLGSHKEMLEAVLNATNDAILVLDETYHVVMINNTGAARFGLEAEAMLGRGVLELTDAPVAASRRERYRQVQASGRPERFTDQRAGRVYENTIYPIPAAAGGRPRLAIYARDITEQLAADAAMRESQERLATIFRLAPVVVSITSLPDGRYLDVNEAFCAITGFPPEAVIGRSNQELGLWLNLADRDRIFRAIERDGLVRNLELSLRMRDGRVVTTLLSCTPIEAYGRPCLLSIVVDITGRKSMEEALRLAKDSAEAANKAKSRFLSTMSHEIRTPMNTILGMVDVLRGTPLSERQQEFLRTLEVAGESLMALLSDILELSKIESGVLELAQAPFDPAALLKQTAALLAPQAEAKHLRLRLEIAPDVPGEAFGDPGRLRQILINLAGNAIKFTAHGEVCLRLALLPARFAREDLLFSVSDTGIGIPQEKHESIFQPFTQVDSSTTRSYGGTGLGLAISTLLADGLGGRLWLESTPGQGSTFFCAVPRDCRSSRDQQRGLPQACQPSTPPALTRRRSLLVVEDSEPNRNLYDAFLEGLPLAVRYAVTGAQALECIEDGPFDAIVMDIQLPDLDGFAVIQEIRRREAAYGRPPTPIMVVTAYAFREERGRAEAAGANLLLTKPIQKVRFLAALGQILDDAGQGAAPGA